jgi:uncharacterized phage protein (TIGR02220 family)
MEWVYFLKTMKAKSHVYFDIWFDILQDVQEHNECRIKTIKRNCSDKHIRCIIRYGLQIASTLNTDVDLSFKKGCVFSEARVIAKKTTKQPRQKEVKKTISQETESVKVEPKKQTPKDDMDLVYSEIITYLNQKTLSGYQHTTKSYTNLIDARLKDGFSLQDFVTVIDKKTEEWMGTDFEKFLRPETLFGNKFQTYLNQKFTPKRNKQQNAYEQVSKATELGWGVKN